MGDSLFAGTRVKHATKTDWGLGEVLDAPQGGKIRVFFEDVGLKEFDPKFAKFTVVSGDEASSDYLTGLVSYLKKHGATASSPKKSASAQTTFKDATAKFLHYFPNGFSDPEYSRHERDYKDAAHRVMLGLLGKDSMADLLSRNDFLEVCNRVKSIINKTNLICPYEKIWLGNGLTTPEAQQTFAQALNILLHCESSMKERFEKFAETLYQINAAKWPIATYFWFIFDPKNHVFVKPEVTKKMASAIGCEINYQPELKWLLLRPVNSMIEFKQIIGRGTRLYDGKDYFTIYDFVKAHHHFNDPEWDGEPLDPEVCKKCGNSPCTCEKTPPKPCSVCGQHPCVCEKKPCPKCGSRPCTCKKKAKIKLADGKERHIQHMSATSFWHPDGTPMSAAQFMEALFGMVRCVGLLEASPTLAPYLWPEVLSRLKAGTTEGDITVARCMVMLELYLSCIACWDAQLQVDEFANQTSFDLLFPDFEADEIIHPNTKFFAWLAEYSETKRNFADHIHQITKPASNTDIGSTRRQLRRWKNGNGFPSHDMLIALFQNLYGDHARDKSHPKHRNWELSWTMAMATKRISFLLPILAPLSKYHEPSFPFGTTSVQEWRGSRYPHWYEYWLPRLQKRQ